MKKTSLLLAAGIFAAAGFAHAQASGGGSAPGPDPMISSYELPTHDTYGMRDDSFIASDGDPTLVLGAGPAPGEVIVYSWEYPTTFGSVAPIDHGFEPDLKNDGSPYPAQ